MSPPIKQLIVRGGHLVSSRVDQLMWIPEQAARLIVITLLLLLIAEAVIGLLLRAITDGCGAQVKPRGPEVL
jgi:hypothetical protein